MAKEQYDNTENAEEARSALAKVVKIGFWLSTISSSVALSVAVWQLATTTLGEFGSDWAIPLPKTVAILGIALTIRFCYMVDFFGIYQSGRLFATEFFAWLAARKGVFGSFAALRTVSMLLWGMLFTGFFALSFFTSWYGADLVKAFISPKINSEKYEKMARQRVEATKEVTQEQLDRIAAIQLNKANAVAAVGNKKLRKLVKEANGWAIQQLDSLQKAAAAPFDKELAEVRKEKAKVSDKFEASYAIVETARVTEAQAELNSQLSQASAIGLLTKGFGVFPLIMSALGLIIMAIAEVSEKETKAAKKNNAGGGNGSSGFSGKGKGKQHNSSQKHSGGYGGNSQYQNFP